MRRLIAVARGSRVVRGIALALAALVLLALGTVWSPQTREVNDLRKCVHDAHAYDLPLSTCDALVEKVAASN